MVRQYLRGASFPASANDLEQTARQNAAPAGVIRGFGRLPRRTFRDADEVEEAYEAGNEDDEAIGREDQGTEQMQDARARTATSDQAGQEPPSEDIGASGETGHTGRGPPL